MSIFEKANLLAVLNSFGDVVETKNVINSAAANKIIEKYNQHYKVYNKRDSSNKRYGLSLTSLDGGFSGIPDLDSLSQYRQETGIDHLETDFTTPTPLLTELNNITNVFKKYDIGRSHIIKMDKGGHFPPHRDLDDTFRLICWLDSNPPRDIMFVLENRVLHLEQGIFYFINTIKYHSVFSFVDNNKMIVINAVLDEKNVHQLIKDRLYS